MKNFVMVCAVTAALFLSHQAHADRALVISKQQVNCLAQNIYFEAKNQSFAGKLAVGLVTLNRVQDSRYPDTVCGVVKQGDKVQSLRDPKVMVPVRNRCKFSWYCDGKADIITEKEIYEEIRNIALKMMLYPIIDFTDGATHYHADYVKPSWAKVFRKTVVIDNHLFYRWESAGE